MADTPKILAQSDPPAATLTDIYTAPANGAVISTISICNRSASAVDSRLSFAIGGAADSVEQYMYYDLSIPGNDNLQSTCGIALGNGDVVRAYAIVQQLSFILFGWEL